MRALVVDDSATMRSLVTRALQVDPQIIVAGSATCSAEARERIKALSPDVMVLDVEMPGMDGLAFLEKVMALRPMPVIMCSTLTGRGADATVEALQLGAIGCVEKPTSPAGIDRMGVELRQLVRMAASVRLGPRASGQSLASPGQDSAGPGRRLIAVGASTGGVEALTAILATAPANCPPILIVQHMPPGFTGSLARRLDQQVAPRVVEATDGMTLEPGLVAIAPGGDRHMTVMGGARGRILLRTGPPVSGHRPSVDALFRSLVPSATQSVGVILTGMGSDGAIGLAAMRSAGAATIGQDEESCTVFGMPRAAAERDAVERQLPLHMIMDAALVAACQ